jgi:S-adenosylmethionine:tRNA ribosyltransferase-isomerase
MSETKKIFIKEFEYNLPEDRIAKFPLENREDSKLLIYRNGLIEESVFKNITGYLPENSCLIFNNTKVIQARIYFQKETGARIEIFCLEPYHPSDYHLSFQSTGQCIWKCMVGNAKRWKEEKISKIINVSGNSVELVARKIASEAYSCLVEFSWNNRSVTFADILESAGQLPIPPYLHREACEKDKETYQTIYSKVKGSVAAPTAGLHFTENVLASLAHEGITTDEVTLHVGAGTFQPVKSETVNEHEMHAEFFSVSKSVVVNILENLHRIIAVGTTSVRTLESLYYIGCLLEEKGLEASGRMKVRQWQPYEKENRLPAEDALRNILAYIERNNLEILEAETRIIITPGYTFKIVKGIITNFHQPQSTLLLLIAAFVGENWKKIYQYAMENDFRFLSYGDSSLLFSCNP